MVTTRMDTDTRSFGMLLSPQIVNSNYATITSGSRRRPLSVATRQLAQIGELLQQPAPRAIRGHETLHALAILNLTRVDIALGIDRDHM